MKTETISRRINKNGSFAVLIITIVIACNACTMNCKQEIAIYQGRYFQKGQNFELSIEDKLLLTEKFQTELQRNEIKKIQDYCCIQDSCKVKFTLGNNDTTFYISPNKTRRLKVGSDIYGKFSVATDENKRAWIEM
jgi:hypothetical protein